MDKAERRVQAPNPQGEDYEMFTTLTSPLPCHVCRALTTWAHIHRWEKASADFMLRAYCPQHGFAERIAVLGEWDEQHQKSFVTELEQQEISASIVRFVLWHHGNVGSAEVIASIAPEKAIGFHVWQVKDFDAEGYYLHWKETEYPQAWTVRYYPQSAMLPLYFIVVYDPYYQQFHLCSSDGTCKPPQHTQPY